MSVITILLSMVLYQVRTKMMTKIVKYMSEFSIEKIQNETKIGCIIFVVENIKSSFCTINISTAFNMITDVSKCEINSQ